jgi:hypothetical protein
MFIPIQPPPNCTRGERSASTFDITKYRYLVVSIAPAATLPGYIVGAPPAMGLAITEIVGGAETAMPEKGPSIVERTAPALVLASVYVADFAAFLEAESAAKYRIDPLYPIDE